MAVKLTVSIQSAALVVIFQKEKMVRKSDRKNYHGIQSSFVRNLRTFHCTGLTPMCVMHKSYGYKKTRVNQPYCIPCMIWKGILDDYKIRPIVAQKN